MPIRTIEKLGLNITNSSLYVINMAKQSKETRLGQINGCKVIIGSKEYFFTFYIIYTYLNKNSYLLFLDKS